MLQTQNLSDSRAVRTPLLSADEFSKNPSNFSTFEVGKSPSNSKASGRNVQG